MPLQNSYIPYRAYWSSPFCRWQGALSQINSVELLARAVNRFCDDRQVSTESFDGLVPVLSGLGGGESVVVEGGYGLPDGTPVTTEANEAR